MTASSEFEPIFVHASPRSGSTYFFNVLRRNGALMCFNEAINDVFAYWGKRVTDRYRSRVKWDTNHHFLEQHDFVEIVEAWDAVMHLNPTLSAFQDYLPPGGTLSPELHRYLAGLIEFAAARRKRAALCEIFSRGRAGALRGAFGGLHIAQYRDPLSQFGSFYRPLPQHGEWYFLVFPLMELGIGGSHPLYALVPEQWQVPVKPWPVNGPARRWASTIEYLAMVASPAESTLEKVFRWHLFSWMLNNLAAISYADFILDIDKVHDDAAYRRSIVEALTPVLGDAPDFSDVAKFSRYYDFETFDVRAVCDQVSSAMRAALRDGRIDNAVRSLGTTAPMVPTAQAVEMLTAKIDDALAAMVASKDCRRVSAAEWRTTASKHQKIWFDPRLRIVGQHVYPFAAPVLRLGRRGWHLLRHELRSRAAAG